MDQPQLTRIAVLPSVSSLRFADDNSAGSLEDTNSPTYLVRSVVDPTRVRASEAIALEESTLPVRSAMETVGILEPPHADNVSVQRPGMN